jgi:spore coat protein SA
MLFGRPQRRGARAAYGILDERIVLLYVGRIRPEKGLLDLIEAVEKIVQRGEREPLLLVAGSGTLGYEAQRTAHPELQAYEQQVRHRAASLPVRFLGEVPRPDLPRLYRAADIFVCPSVYEEPFGMVNVEAAAAGLPVIATSVGGIPEAVLHEHNGLLVSAGDAQALADALLRLMSDSSLRYRLGRVAQDLASQHDWRVLTGKVAEIYDRALRQRSEKAGVIA